MKQEDVKIRAVHWVGMKVTVTGYVEEQRRK